MPEGGAFTLVAVAAAFFLGGFVKGTTGFGLPMVSIPLAAMVIDLHLAIALTTLPALATSLWQAFAGRQSGWVLRSFWPMYVAMAAGVFGGAALLVNLDPRSANGALGLLLLMFVAISWAHPEWAIPPRRRTPIGVVAGLAAGAMGGLSGIFGPPILMYLQGIGMARDRFISTLNITWIVATVLLMVTLSGLQVLTAMVAMAGLALAAPTFAGLLAGQAFGARLDPRTFRRWVLALLAAISVELMRGAVW